MYFILLIAIVLLFYYFYLKPDRYWKSKNVPQDNSYPFFGHMGKSFLKKKHFAIVLQEMYNKYSDSKYFGFVNFQTPILVVKDPELIKAITVKDFEVFPHHRPLADETIDPLWSNNLFAIQNFNKWRQIRSALSPAFTASKMKQMFELMHECAKNFSMYYLQQENDVIELDIKDAFKRYANDVIGSTAFGVTCNSLKEPNNQFFKMGENATNFDGIKAIKFFLNNLSPFLVKILRIRIFEKEVEHFFNHVVKESIRIKEEQGIVRPDMIHLLLEARKGKLKQEKVSVTDQECNGFAEVEESEIIRKEAKWLTEITDEEITSHAMLFFLAGYENNSSLMSFAIVELAANPDIQQKLFADVFEVYERSGGHLKYEDVQKIKYLDMVLSETLRKWSVEMFLDRQADKSYTIHTKEGKPPLEIKKGDTIWVPSFCIHRDPNFYPDPDIFDPERFSDERKHEIKPFTYFPFGTGPRNCIGSRYALLSTKIVVYYLVLHFELLLSPSVKIPIQLDKNHIFLKVEGGFQVRLKRRALKYFE